MWILIPFFLQTLLMIVDEREHHKRGLPRWERIGHPLDTLIYIGLLIFCWRVPYSESSLVIFILWSVLSLLLITKDEWVHHEHCSGFEQWLHSLLFILHPIVLASYGWLWFQNGLGDGWLGFIFLGILLFLYQWVYWNHLYVPQARSK